MSTNAERLRKSRAKKRKLGRCMWCNERALVVNGEPQALCRKHREARREARA